MRLKANKTNLYKLVSEHASLPCMKQTVFYKAPRRPDYFLDWHDGGERYQAFLAACMGNPLLTIEAASGRQVHRLTIQDLQDRGMIDNKEYVTCKTGTTTSG